MYCTIPYDTDLNKNNLCRIPSTVSCALKYLKKISFPKPLRVFIVYDKYVQLWEVIRLAVLHRTFITLLFNIPGFWKKLSAATKRTAVPECPLEGALRQQKSHQFGRNGSFYCGRRGGAGVEVTFRSVC